MAKKVKAQLPFYDAVYVVALRGPEIDSIQAAYKALAASATATVPDPATGRPRTLVGPLGPWVGDDGATPRLASRKGEAARPVPGEAVGGAGGSGTGYAIFRVERPHVRGNHHQDVEKFVAQAARKAGVNVTADVEPESRALSPGQPLPERKARKAAGDATSAAAEAPEDPKPPTIVKSPVAA